MSLKFGILDLARLKELIDTIRDRFEFVNCYFANVRNCLSSHKNLEHLTFYGGCVKLPFLHNLRELKVHHFDGMYYANYIQVIRNNRQLKVIEIHPWFCDRAIWGHRMCKTVSTKFGSTLVVTVENKRKWPLKYAILTSHNKAFVKQKRIFASLWATLYFISIFMFKIFDWYGVYNEVSIGFSFT